jgi:membrane-associated phospholipid phosphatase
VAAVERAPRFVSGLALGLAGVALAAAVASAATAADTLRTHPPLLTRRDAWFGVTAAAAIAVVGVADEGLWRNASASVGDGGRWLADAVRPFGRPQVLVPGLVLGLGAGCLLDRPGLTQASARISVAVVAAAAAAEAVKVTVGRSRPSEAPGDADEFRPFSGHDSFPSGHATVAFAAAAALDREATTRWVAWAAYPIAGLVGWSRVRDDRHWASDVVAGAALGLWTADKVEDFARSRWPGRTGPRLSVEGGAAGVRLAARIGF